MRRLRVLMVAVVLLTVIPSTAALAVKPEKSTFKGETASAFWENDGMFVDVFLNVGSFSFGGETFDFASVDMFIFQDTGTGFVSWFGGAELEPDQYELDASGGSFSAMVDAEIELFGDECSFEGESCTDLGQLLVSLEVTWDETKGRMYPSMFMGRSLFPSGFEAFFSKSMARSTTADGAISGDLELDLGSTPHGFISRNTDTSRFKVTIE